MSGTNNKSGTKPGNLSKSFFEQLTETAKDETSKITKGMAASLAGRFPPSATETHNGLPMSPEFMPPVKKKERTPEIQLFSYQERHENLKTRDDIKQLLNEIKREIHALEKNQKGLLNDAAKITLESVPDKPGVYHIRFLEWVLRTIRELRIKVSESGAWFSMVVSKRKQGYHAMAKKHGTSFTQNNERTVATQSG